MKNLLFLLSFLPLLGITQRDSTTKIVQITGITVSSDSLKPVPFASILIKGNYTGTISDYSGFYSIVASTGDTLVFTSLGYKTIEYVIPDSLQDQQYSLIQIMGRDTFAIPIAVIDIWPSYEQFKQAFVNKEIPNSELERAEKNLSKDVLNQQAISLNLGATGNQKLLNQQHNAKLYYSGQLPPNNLLNPVAWAKLIKAWQAGDFDVK
jgi:hypothetical protein|tara:strand:- start:470 stop:1093 length:624 start_codon:yes stop_codon:yes gene_type:complete